ncbi:hypothetical protein PPSIR1_03438 [Plesiocystis pacifica SIR-1]|uniref:Lipoprotein n=1 Tax=Plesiocystis pacifica SIR-1 TaxID=391625 RepID=A6G5E7_9BACT|nr:hypothetical protein [Plesiocystis pacifica]EDM78890.1 hypothetical protein PPSIR1_03438 [Plesiocystis pacifica SIR-1]
MKILSTDISVPLVGLALIALGLSSGCAASAKRSPQGLREAYAAALRADDPDAAYALLAPEVQARTDIESFRERWARNGDRHHDTLEAIDDLDDDRQGAVITGTTTHEGGVVIHWAQTRAGFLVVDGLPGIPDTSTPTSAARALVAALRSISAVQLERVLATTLIERLGEDWNARADAIEAALTDPGAITYSGDNTRAMLRYGGGRLITFEQTPQGWRVSDLR